MSLMFRSLWCGVLLREFMFSRARLVRFDFISNPFLVLTQHEYMVTVCVSVSNLLFILLLVFANVYCALLMQL